jgi:hypothetical protein
MCTPSCCPPEEMMIMPDPLVVLRQSEAELRAVDPWTRARLRMEAGERAEAAAAEEARRARVEQAEMRRA